MKPVFIALLCFGLATVALADVKIVQKVKNGPMLGQPAKDTTVTMYIKGHKARSESAATKTFQLIDIDSGKVYIVDPGKKSAIALTTAQLKQTMGMMGQIAGGSKAKPSVEKTGTSHTYNGYKCDDVKIVMTGNPAFGLNAISCICPTLEVKEFEPFKDFGQDFAKAFGVDLNAGMPGFAVHSDIKMMMMGQNVDSTSDLVSISRDKLDDSLFVLPADYTVKEPKVPAAKKP